MGVTSTPHTQESEVRAMTTATMLLAHEFVETKRYPEYCQFRSGNGNICTRPKGEHRAALTTTWPRWVNRKTGEFFDKDPLERTLLGTPEQQCKCRECTCPTFTTSLTVCMFCFVGRHR